MDNVFTINKLDGSGPQRTPRNRRLVIIESPYAGDVAMNTAYARAAMKDSLLRGEAPLASHLLYTQPGVLDDTVALERAWGIDAGLAWRWAACAAIFYMDLGLSPGMSDAMNLHRSEGRIIETRLLGTWEYNP